MSESKAPQDYYPENAAHCFGCGRLNAHGHQLKTYQEGDETVSRFTPQPYHTAIPGFVYGGLLASLIDCHATATASAAAERAAGRSVGDGPAPRFVTASLHVNYLQPTPLGPVLEVRGKVAQLSERKVVVEATIFADGNITVSGEVVVVPLPKRMQ